MTDTLYKYSTTSPKSLTRRSLEDLPGHRMGWRKRVNTLLAAGQRGKVAYEWRCLCGDHGTGYLPWAVAKRQWEGHMAKASEQMRMVVDV